MGYLIDPPRPIEGDFVAVFQQTSIGDELALALLRERGLDAKPFPLMGDLAFEGFGGMLGGSSLFGGQSLVCVRAADADEALDILEFDSGLVED